ncbi:MAG: hypothetical protein N3A71_03990 [Candidatus Dojkabacteria bacterium]|nr:hypothetical protein [Candidatus Dojkabacteria bacterium]
MQNPNNSIDLDPENDLKLPPELKITSGIPSIQSLQTFTPPSDIPQKHMIDDGLPPLPDERLAIEVTTDQNNVAKNSTSVVTNNSSYINENTQTNVKNSSSKDNISMLINIGIGIVIVLVLVMIFLVLVYFNIVPLSF